MWQQTKQVGMTYVTRRWVMVGMLAIVVLFIVGPLLLLVISDREPRAIAMALKMSNVALMCLGFWLVMMAKSQFAHPRARLMPGYAGPHVGTFAALLVAGVGVYPSLLALASGSSFLGVTAMAAVVTCCLIWATYRTSILWALGVMLILLSQSTHTGSQFWYGEEIQQTLAHAGLLIAGWSGLLFWLWRLPHLNEEMPEYQLTSWQLAMGTSRRLRSQHGQKMAQQITRIPLWARFADRWHDRIADYPRSSRRRVAWLLRYGFASTPISLRAVTGAGVFSVIALTSLLAYLAVQVRYSQELTLQGVALTLWFLFFLPVWMPTAIVVGELAMRLPRLSGELLRPLRRVQLVEGLFWTMASKVAVLWFAFHLATMGTAYLVFPDLFNPQLIATFLLLSIAFQPILFTILVSFCARRGIRGMQLGSVIVVFAAYTTLAFWWFKRTDWGDGVFVIGALAMALGGIAMLARVRRRWLNLEFG